jgi:hypothetical protein
MRISSEASLFSRPGMLLSVHLFLFYFVCLSVMGSMSTAKVYVSHMSVYVSTMSSYGSIVSSYMSAVLAQKPVVSITCWLCRKKETGPFLPVALNG